MKSLRNYLLAAIGFAILVGSLVLSGPLASSAAPPPDKDVVVVNPRTQPVPVEIEGTPSVNVTNTPTVRAQQQGSWNVGIIGTPTVQIANLAVPVRDVDNPAIHPFQKELDPLVPAGSFTASDSLTVPLGKRLVIEFASATISTTAGTKLWVRIQTTANGSINFHSLLPELQGPFSADGSDFLLAAQPMKIYADPGTQVTVIASVLGGVANTNTGAGVVMSGHFVDVP